MSKSAKCRNEENDKMSKSKKCQKTRICKIFDILYIFNTLLISTLCRFLHFDILSIQIFDIFYRFRHFFINLTEHFQIPKDRLYVNAVESFLEQIKRCEIEKLPEWRKSLGTRICLEKNGSAAEKLLEVVRKANAIKICCICRTDKPSSSDQSSIWKETDETEKRILCYECNRLFEGGKQQLKRDAVKLKKIILTFEMFSYQRTHSVSTQLLSFLRQQKKKKSLNQKRGDQVQECV